MWQQIFNEYLIKFTKNEKQIYEFNQLNSDINRIKYCLHNNLPSEQDKSNLDKKYSFMKTDKDRLKSKAFRLEGNDYFKKKNLILAFDKYTLAIIYAPDMSEELMLGLSNRSAVFYELNLYKNCLNDLNYLKSINNNQYPESLRLKLMLRETFCAYHIGNMELFNQNFNHLKEIKENECLTKLTKILNVKRDDEIVLNNDLQTNLIIKKPNLLYPCMINSIDVRMTPEKGRYCRVNEYERDIQPGEILFIERPYCAILLPEFSDCYCELCFKSIVNKTSNFLHLNIHTCDYCSNVLYCSFECKKLSLKNHKYECFNIKNLLQDLGISHLAYKILASTDINVLRKHGEININDDNELEMIQTYTKSLNTESNFTTNGYSSIFYLVSNSNQTHINDSFSYALTATLLAKYFIQSYSNETISLPLIGSLILRHIKQIICNAHAITTLEVEEEDTMNHITYETNQIKYATAIYPCVSLMNHSCNPNVICSFKCNSNQIIIKSTRIIPSGSEVVNCYGPHYLKMPRLLRLQSLKQQYYFNCECNYCSNQDLSYLFKCLKCDSIHLQYKFSKKSFEACCNKCNCVLSYNDYDKYLNKIEVLSERKYENELAFLEINRLYETILFVKSNDEIDLIKKFIDAKRDNIDFYYYVNYCKHIDALTRLNCEKNDFKQASRNLKMTINLLKIIYNNSSIEISFELFKLSEILCNCNEFAQALEYVKEAISIADTIYIRDNNLLKQFHNLRENILKILS